MKFFIQATAEADILGQVEWHASQGLPEIARRFHTAVILTTDAHIAMPGAGTLNPQPYSAYQPTPPAVDCGAGQLWVEQAEGRASDGSGQTGD